MAGHVAAVVLELLGPDPAPVALLMDVEAAVIPAIYGVLAAGKFYVPMDPGPPPARLEQLLEGHGMPVVADPWIGTRLASGLKGIRVLDVDALPDPSGPPKPVFRHRAGAQAYIIYTSGSTGRPKGDPDPSECPRGYASPGSGPGHGRLGLLRVVVFRGVECLGLQHLWRVAQRRGGHLLRHQSAAAWRRWPNGLRHTKSAFATSVWNTRLFAATLKGTERFPKMRMIAPDGNRCTGLISSCAVVFSPGIAWCRTARNDGNPDRHPVLHGSRDAGGRRARPGGVSGRGQGRRPLGCRGRETDEGEIVIRSRYLRRVLASARN